MGAAANAHRVLLRKPGGNLLFLCRPRHRLGDDIKMDRKEIDSGVRGLLFGRASEVLGTCMYTVPPIASSYPTDHSTLRLPS